MMDCDEFGVLDSKSLEAEEFLSALPRLDVISCKIPLLFVLLLGLEILHFFSTFIS